MLGARRASEMENHYRRAGMIIIMPPAKQVHKDGVSEPVKSVFRHCNTTARTPLYLPYFRSVRLESLLCGIDFTASSTRL